MTEKLCYIEDNFAYFTTAENQWGDDWNDAPYEHNAGTPYGWRPTDKVPEYKITVVAYKSELETPAELAGCNSRYSVEMINKGAIAWLAPASWSTASESVQAGCSIEEFTRIIQKTGGDVFTAVENAS